MRRRRLLTLLLAFVACFLAGCALRPDHVTVFCERDDAETDGPGRGSRTTTNKVGGSITYDLSRR